MKFALETWMDEVESEAKKQEALEIAKRLKAEGLGVDAIARATGLTVADVLRL
jgi:predicted transposase YdaD